MGAVRLSGPVPECYCLRPTGMQLAIAATALALCWRCSTALLQQPLLRKHYLAAAAAGVALPNVGAAPHVPVVKQRESVPYPIFPFWGMQLWHKAGHHSASKLHSKEGPVTYAGRTCVIQGENALKQPKNVPNYQFLGIMY